MVDILRMDYINSLPQPFIARFYGGSEWPVYDIEVQTGLLRAKLGFNGVLTSDDMEMKAISGHYGLAESVPLAIAAAAMLSSGNARTVVSAIRTSIASPRTASCPGSRCATYHT